VVMWQKASEFELGTNFEAWSFRIARFQVMAHRKRQQRSRLHFDDELLERLAAEAEREFAGSDLRRAVLTHCLRNLAPSQRQLIARRYEPGASVQELV